jgi:sterol desaturase/sphingolipid hydroxylase (fatty acid hydroxylase superfamily)
VLALAAAIIWLLTMPAIGVFDDPTNGLYLGLALFAAHFAVDLGVPWPRR